MRYDGLERSYMLDQVDRVEKLRSKIAEREVVASGRVVPEPEDLVIGTGRQVTATVMFTDICGFSARDAATPTEQAMMLRVLNLYFSEMVGIVEDYGGTVEKNTGDGLMAYFESGPLDILGNSATQRAVACALTMFAVNDVLVSPILRASGVHPLEFRVSMDHGPVTIARLGLPQRFTSLVAIGNAANFASKMLGHISANEVGLGANAEKHLPTAWRTQYSQLSAAPTGWTFRRTRQPYPLYVYTGRWARLI